MTSAYTATVFVIVPIDNVMTAVFDAPVAAVGGKNALRIGLLWGSTGDAVGDFTRIFAAFFICGFPLDGKSLSNVGKVQIVIEFGGGPDFSDFDPAMIGRIISNEIRLLAILEIEFNIFKESGLIAFNGEVVMRFPFLEQIVGDLALGQQGIGGNFFTLNIDGIK